MGGIVGGVGEAYGGEVVGNCWDCAFYGIWGIVVSWLPSLEAWHVTLAGASGRSWCDSLFCRRSIGKGAYGHAYVGQKKCRFRIILRYYLGTHAVMGCRAERDGDPGAEGCALLSS